MRILSSSEFEKRYHRLPSDIQDKTKKQLEFLKIDMHYPSLHTEKLAPKSKEIWSFRVDRNFRVLFRFVDPDQILLMTVGSHDWIYQKL